MTLDWRASVYSVEQPILANRGSDAGWFGAPRLQGAHEVILQLTQGGIRPVAAIDFPRLVQLTSARIVIVFAVLSVWLPARRLLPT